MSESENSTNVRIPVPSNLAELAALFLQPQRRFPVSASWPPPGAESLRVEREGNALVGWGWGKGPAVLLVHGWEGAAAQLGKIGEALASHGFRAVAFDLPAHGASGGTRASLPIFVQALRTIAAQHGPFVGAVAHSFGGAAVVLAELPLQRVALLAPAAEPIHFVRAFARALEVPEASLDPLIAEVWKLVGTALPTLDVPTVAARFQGELRVFHDPADVEVPLAHGRAIAQAASHGALREVPGAGHRRICSDPTVLTALTRFFDPPSRELAEAIHG